MSISKAPLDFYKYKEKAHSIEFASHEIPNYPLWAQKYFAYYELDFSVPHYFGTFDSENYQIVAHYFEPGLAKKTVFLIHGYLEHTANFHLLIKRLIQENYAIFAFDLPGHGLSSGLDSSIKSFQEYGRIINDLIGQTKNKIKPVYAILGHSTGGAAVIEYLRAYDSPFEIHILGAPLVRSQMWDLSKLGYNILGGVIKTLPSLLRDISSDKEYINFLRYHDPLLRKTADMDWVKALFEWDRILVNTKIITTEQVNILQGKKDVVVSWKYNMDYLSKRMPNSEIFYYDEAKHDIFHEKDEIREQIFNKVVSELDSKNPELCL